MPGGPSSNTPFGILAPSSINFCGLFKNSTTSSSSSLASLAPATSWKKVVGPAGGTVVCTERSSSLYGVKIEIPAGALAQKATIVISESGAASSPAMPAGIRCNYSPAGISSTEPFLQDIKITFPTGNIVVND